MYGTHAVTQIHACMSHTMRAVWPRGGGNQYAPSSTQHLYPAPLRVCVCVCVCACVCVRAHPVLYPVVVLLELCIHTHTHTHTYARERATVSLLR